MNQILDYNPNKSSGGNSSNSDTIVRIFAIILIIFALCLLGSGIYNLTKNNEAETEKTAAPTQAKIDAEQTDTEIIVKVSHDKAINKLTYKWDTDKEVTNTGNGESTMEVKIPLLSGEHVLDVKVTDIDGVESTYQGTFTSETGVDSTYPEITLEVTPESKLKITATDETEISFITYRWNEDEEVRIEATEEEQKEIVEEIDILKGKNDLTVVAVDKANNSSNKMESYTGLTNPEITINVAEDKKSAEIQCSHENGIKEIKLNLNGEELGVELPEENPKDVVVPIENLTEPTNKLVVTVISVDGTEKVAEEEIKTEEAPSENIEIFMEKLEDDANKVVISTKTESGVKEMYININGEEFSVDMSELPEDTKEVVLNPIELIDDVTKIKVTVISKNDVEKVDEKEFTK